MEFLCQYEVREILAMGMFSEVKRCIDKRTKEAYAVKIVTYSSDQQKKRIKNEIKILQSLSHHNIVRLHCSYPSYGTFYFITELLVGGELFDDLVARTTYSERTAREIMQQLLDAVSYCHEMKTVQRNIRPEKLVLAWRTDHASQTFPPVKLTGFSLAKKLPENSNTIWCGVEGSPLYLAPEVITHDAVGTDVDVWACAVVMYLLLAGYPPFFSTKRDELFSHIANGRFSFPSPEWSSISPSAKSLLCKMLSVDPSTRITAAQALNESWMRDDVPIRHRKNTLENLCAFNAKRKLKGAVYTMLAMNSLQDKHCTVNGVEQLNGAPREKADS